MLLATIGMAPCLSVAASEEATASSASAKESGILFRAWRGDSTVFLYGTVHVGAESFYPLSPRVLRPLRQAQALLVEVDLLATDLPETFRRYGTLPADAAPLAIAESDARLVDPLLREARIDPAFARRFKPDVLAGTLGALSAAELGFTTPYAVDSFLLGFARAGGVRVIELEGLKMQLTMNDALPAPRRQAILDDTLTALASGRSTRAAARLVAAWRQHDIDLLTSSDEHGTPADQQQAFLDQMAMRNAAMSRRISALGAEHQHVFAAVGVLHLPGREGLPRLLELDGYRVVRLM